MANYSITVTYSSVPVGSLFSSLLSVMSSFVFQALANTTNLRSEIDMDHDECGPTQLWELPDSECQNFHWVGYLAMELAKGEIVLSSKLLLLF